MSRRRDEFREIAEPAPVITDEGAWGALPPPFEFPEQRRRRPMGPWWTGTALAFVGTLLLGAFSLQQATARDVAIPALERGIAALAELDALIDTHAGAICAAAGQNPSVQLPGFPVPAASVPRERVGCTDGTPDRAALRGALLAGGAELVYLRGTEAFRFEQAASDPDSAIRGDGGGMRLLLDSIGADEHDLATLAMWPLAALTVALFALFWWRARGGGRLAGLAAVSIVTSLPVLGIAAFGRLVLWMAGNDDPLAAETEAITRALLWLPARNATWLALAGCALLVPALVFRGRGSRDR